VDDAVGQLPHRPRHVIAVEGEVRGVHVHGEIGRWDLAEELLKRVVVAGEVAPDGLNGQEHLALLSQREHALVRAPDQVPCRPVRDVLPELGGTRVPWSRPREHIQSGDAVVGRGPDAVLDQPAVGVEPRRVELDHILLHDKLGDAEPAGPRGLGHGRKLVCGVRLGVEVSEGPLDAVVAELGESAHDLGGLHGAKPEAREERVLACGHWGCTSRAARASSAAMMAATLGVPSGIRRDLLRAGGPRRVVGFRGVIGEGRVDLQRLIEAAGQRCHAFGVEVCPRVSGDDAQPLLK